MAAWRANPRFVMVKNLPKCAPPIVGAACLLAGCGSTVASIGGTAAPVSGGLNAPTLSSSAAGTTAAVGGAAQELSLPSAPADANAVPATSRGTRATNDASVLASTPTAAGGRLPLTGRGFDAKNVYIGVSTYQEFQT